MRQRSRNSTPHPRPKKNAGLSFYPIILTFWVRRLPGGVGGFRREGVGVKKFLRSLKSCFPPFETQVKQTLSPGCREFCRDFPDPCIGLLRKLVKKKFVLTFWAPKCGSSRDVGELKVVTGGTDPLSFWTPKYGSSRDVGELKVVVAQTQCLKDTRPQCETHHEMLCLQQQSCDRKWPYRP